MYAVYGLCVSIVCQRLDQRQIGSGLENSRNFPRQSKTFSSEYGNVHKYNCLNRLLVDRYMGMHLKGLRFKL
jgi:hypothetical protein